jgi:superfamily I DNA/RNA helicase
VVSLRENFRTGPQLWHCIRTLAGSLPGVKEMEATGSAALPPSSFPPEIHYFEAHNADSEADWVAGQIRRCLGATSHSLLSASGDNGPGEAYSPGDFAVLLRSRALMPRFALALERRGIPFSQPGAEGFWEDSRVALILQSAGQVLGITPPLKAETGADLPPPPECPERILGRGPEAMAAYWGNRDPFDAAFWKSRAFKDLSRAFDQNRDWAGLFNWLSLRNELEEVRLKSEKVQLLTLHAAKGLEFRMVFLPALEDGLLPFAGPESWSEEGRLKKTRSQEGSEPEYAEEFRLFYVGLTRARQGLFLSRAEERRLYGLVLRLPPSPFLQKLPQQGVRHSRMIAERGSRMEQMKLF